MSARALLNAACVISCIVNVSPLVIATSIFTHSTVPSLPVATQGTWTKNIPYRGLGSRPIPGGCR